MIGNLLILLATFAILCQHASAQYTLSAFAGTGTQGSDGDNGPATSAKLNFVPGVWTDSSGQTFIVDYSANNIRRVDTSGIIKTIGGTGSASVASSGGAFTSVDLYSPWGLFGDTAGTTLYISDNYHVWKYNRASGIVSILAGTGSQGTAGDGGPAISAQINKANGLWLATTNILYIGEYGNNLVRMINLNTGIISTYAGGGGAGLGGDGGPAVSTNTKLNSPQGIYLDTNGQLFVADRSNGRIRLIAGGIITTYAGGGPSSNTADGYAATNAYFSSPFDVKGDSIGNIFIVEGANRVRVVDYATKVVTLYMSTGLSAPRGIWLDRVNGRSLVGMLGYVKSAPLYVNPVSTSAPSAAPTTAVPTVAPTILQTASPSAIPTASPSAQPTFQPTFKPTAVPSAIPSAVPTKAPTVNPSVTPTAIPSFAPTTVPTVNPSAAPTRSPTAKPTVAPTASPTAKPTAKPSTAAPSELPTFMPSPVPGVPTAIPTIAPSETPTATPTFNPSAVPTASPSEIPTATPTAEPTATPSAAPTAAPSEIPTQTPTAMPSAIPTEAPTATPTTTPTAVPSAIPTHSPTEVPTANPTFTPTAVPSEIPTAVPSATPTYVPTATPTYVPTPAPSAQPSSRPTSQPSGSPTQPTFRPTDAPTAVPTVKNPDIVQVSGVSRVKFVNGASLNDLSLSTLLSAFENISVNAFSTVITSSVLVAQSTNNNGGSRRRLTTTFGYYTYDIGFVSSYLMANYPAHTSSQVAAMKSNIIQQKIQVGAFENTLRSMAKDRSAYQLLNGTCNEVTSITTSIITPTTPTTGTTSSSSSSSSLSAGIIAAIVIGVLFGSLLLGFILFVILKRYENSNKKKKLTVERKDSRYSVVL